MPSYRSLGSLVVPDADLHSDSYPKMSDVHQQYTQKAASIHRTLLVDQDICIKYILYSTHCERKAGQTFENEDRIVIRGRFGIQREKSGLAE